MYINYLVHELLLNKLSSWTLMNWFDESIICCSRMFKNTNSLMNIHELEVVPRWRDPQLQVSEIYHV